MAKMNEGEIPGTVPQAGPEPVATPVQPQWIMPRQKQVERMGESGAAVSVRYPQVRGGICEYCGVVNGNYPSEQQYKMCPHYRGQQLRCSYCPAEKDVNDVINHSVLNIAEHPDNPNKLVVWCDSYECSKKHTERFKVSV